MNNSQNCYNKIIINILNKNYLNLRLDKILSLEINNYSRTYLSNLIKQGYVTVNGKLTKEPKKHIKLNTIIEVLLYNIFNSNNIILTPKKFKYQIMYEDNDILIINKPPNTVVHPAPGNWNNTIVNALIYRYSNFTKIFNNDMNIQNIRPGIIHRLDKDTSGCLIIAKHIISKYKLCNSFATGKIIKEYDAILYGVPKYTHEQITTLIGRHQKNRKKMTITDNVNRGKKSITIYNLIKIGYLNKIPISLAKIKILTGRTHQIRVHMAYKGTPILGDKVYGGHQKIQIQRQMLHASKITFPHPCLHKTISIRCPLFQDYNNVLNLIKF